MFIKQYFGSKKEILKSSHFKINRYTSFTKSNDVKNVFSYFSDTHIIGGLSAFLHFFSNSLEGSTVTNTNTYLCNPGCVVRVC